MVQIITKQQTQAKIISTLLDQYSNQTDLGTKLIATQI